MTKSEGKVAARSRFVVEFSAGSTPDRTPFGLARKLNSTLTVFRPDEYSLNNHVFRAYGCIDSIHLAATLVDKRKSLHLLYHAT
jgi:hypothetical protein